MEEQSSMVKLSLFLASVGWNVAFAILPSESLQKLIDGNERYINDKPLYANHSSDRRAALTSKQKPFATILGCSDSRVSPEIVFDQGLGDLFVVRVAGNVVGPIELDSIDYSAKYLGSSLIVVLGHESCGAVSAVRDGKTADIQDLAELIYPSIQDASSLENAIKDNVRAVVNDLKKSRLLQSLIQKKQVNCVGAYYHLATGKVEILNP
jgi:carbonic anhydrase